MHKPHVALLAAATLSLVFAAGAFANAGARFAPHSTAISVMLDWTPNPDHVGLYTAHSAGLFAKAGLAVEIRSPSDATAPLKLVALGRVDVAISYEQEVFYAVEKGLPVSAVAAIIPTPLNVFMSVNPAITKLRDLKAKRIGITGVPSDYATLDTALASVGLARSDVKLVSVGYNLLPALLAHRVDAVLGVYRNVEAIQATLAGATPHVIPVERAGIPTYDELVLVANRHRLDTDASYRTHVAALVAGISAGVTAATNDPALALQTMQKATSLGTAFLKQSTSATLPLLSGPRGPVCLSVGDWHRFGSWMVRQKLLKATVATGAVVTTSVLPRNCG